MNTPICLLVRRVATMPSNIPLVRMSLLTLALTDKSASCEDKKQLAERFELEYVTMLKINVKRN